MQAFKFKQSLNKTLNTQRFSTSGLASAKQVVCDKPERKGFNESLAESLHLHQFKCCSKRWWGNGNNSTCFRCHRNVSKLPFTQMIGIGWFECKCKRVYAGFSRGNVTSKCHVCSEENLPLFIVRGERADREDKDSDKQHYCNVCKGHEDCPIVEEVKRNGSSHPRQSHRRRFY